MPGGDDEPMGDAPPTASTPAPAPKPKRRFAPQLVEETVRSSGDKKEQEDATRNSDSASSKLPAEPTPPMSKTNSVRATRDVSVQVNDVEMQDAPAQQPKPIRRFAPVPIETTFDSYRVNNNVKNPHGPTAELTPDPSPTSPQSPAQNPLQQPLDSQKVSPSPSSLTSSTSTPPPPASSSATASKQTQQNADQSKPKPKRRFTPQLIETTRRARKDGQEGPATKPIDKTDITPGTNHIYVPKPKRKPAPSRAASAGHEVEDAGSPRFLAPRRQGSMKPHPNTRRATRQSSFHPDLDTILSSESGNSSEEGEEDTAPAPPIINLGAPALPDHGKEVGDSWASRNYELRNRRESCDEEFSGYLLAVAAREAFRQRELEQALSAFPNGVRPEGVEHFFVRDNSEDDAQAEDLIVDDGEQLRHGPSQLLRRKSTDLGWGMKEMRAHAEKLAQSRNQTSRMGDAEPEMAPLSADRRLDSHDVVMTDARSPFLKAQSPSLRARMTPSPVQHKGFAPPPAPPPTAAGGGRVNPFSMPFANHYQPPADAEDRELRRMRQAAAPPMLGGDIKFRTCPSPQHTRMEPTQRYAVSQSDRPEEKQRDHSGEGGLWRGYCSSKNEQEQATPGFQAPPLLHTPGDTSPNDPFSAAFSSHVSGTTTGTWTGTGNGSQSPPASPTKGIQMLPGLDERLRKAQARKEREEALAAEFDDAFVTQVYNYISLGYPAMARAFDDELAKISGISVQELRKDDNLKVDKGFMLRMEMRLTDGGSASASSSAGASGDEEEKGRFVSPEADERIHHRHKPPRWKALKLYIREWARQHPSLNGGDGASHLAWGVRARRGSWAI
ncbi:hypothetical protein F5Y15DRAFT_375020 [Xylariaceae sp. FL0016]|nr:hypothetical protein F5Y15DRAFT_375020 [Xylariaceae sp. FL0016]